VLFWSVATWWLPLLIAVMVATFGFAQLVGMPALSFIPRIFLWIAVAAWCVVFFGMLRDLIHNRRLSLAAAPERENAE
jgi:hypothetical protein